MESISNNNVAKATNINSHHTSTAAYPATDAVPTSTVGPLGIGIAISLIIIIFMILYCGKMRRCINDRSSIKKKRLQINQQEENMIQTNQQQQRYSYASSQTFDHHTIIYPPTTLSFNNNRNSVWSSTSTLPIQSQYQQPVPDIQINIVNSK